MIFFLACAMACGEIRAGAGLADCPSTITAYPLDLLPCQTREDLLIGQVLTENIPDGSLEVQISDLPEGMNVLALTNDDGNVFATIEADCGIIPGQKLLKLKAVNSDGLTSLATLVITVKAQESNPAGIADDSPGLGSVLVFNLTTSDISYPEGQNTRINITNSNALLGVAIHLFWVDGDTCEIADSMICLTPNQTHSLLVSDFDPGITGFLVAVAVDRRTGMPVSFNHLMGDEFVKLRSGHSANLRAEAVKSRTDAPPARQDGPLEAVLSFDGTNYQRLPRTLAISNLPSTDDGNEIKLVLNRIGGDYSSMDRIGELYGAILDDQSEPYGFCASDSSCQLVADLTASFPRTSPRIDSIIPSGRSGWLKIWAVNDFPIFGAVIVFNPDSDFIPAAFNSGHNLHALTLCSFATFRVPLYPPTC